MPTDQTDEDNYLIETYFPGDYRLCQVDKVNVNWDNHYYHNIQLLFVMYQVSYTHSIFFTGEEIKAHKDQTTCSS